MWEVMHVTCGKFRRQSDEMRTEESDFRSFELIFRDMSGTQLASGILHNCE